MATGRWWKNACWDWGCTVAKGTLVVNAKNQIRVKWTNSKGNEVEMNVPERELSASLASQRLQPQKLAELNGREVELDEAGGQPRQVRPVGEAFQAPSAVSSRPEQRGGQGPRSQQRPGGGSRGGQGGGPGPGRQAQAPGSPPVTAAQADFHNPYNFIPAPPRNVADAELGDHPPVGHQAYLPGFWSGTIRVRLLTETPLLLPDAARMSETNGHKTYPVRVTADGQPYLPPTSVKGMLRAAFEAVTNSRFGVFHGHDKRLACRMDARIGLRMVPVRIERNTAGKLQVRLEPGTSEIGRADGRPQGPMYAAWLRSYGRSRKNWGKLWKHGAKVWAYVTLWRHERPNFEFWNVVELRDGNAPQPTGSPTDDRQPWQKARPASPSQGHWVVGHVCLTKHNIDNKHDERVFFTAASHPQLSQLALPLTEDVANSWERLISDYQQIHKEEIARGQTKPPALREDAEWSRHVVGGSPETKLREDTCAYGLVESSSGGFKLLGLYPVMIPRELYAVAPGQILSLESLRASTTRERLSPSERVFGWVGQNGEGGYRGQCRIGPVACDKWAGQERGDSAIEHFESALPLAILGQPKPQQVRFYVAQDPQGTPLPRGAEKAEGYQAEQGLRGRKVYPHQARLPADHWRNPLTYRANGAGGHYQEYRRPPGENERDDQNRSIQGWVKPQTEFTFEIQVSNLSEVELGALLWLLDLNRHEPRSQGGAFHHRLGGGKPLGFGSVRLSIDGLELRDGVAWAAWYRSLSAPVAEGRTIQAVSDMPSAEAVKKFCAAVQQVYGQGRAFSQVPFIAAFLRAAQGFSDGLPTHYPRVSKAPDPEGKNFEWFVRNEKPTHRYSLPPLEGTGGGLPLLKEPPRHG